MPGKIVCVRFGEEGLLLLDTLARQLGGTRSGAIRAAVSGAVQICLDAEAVDNETAMRYDKDDLPETSSPGRSEPGTVPPPAVPGLPSPPPGIVCLTPEEFLSRSQLRRIAAQCGESVPEFGVGHDRGAGGHLQSTSDPCPAPIDHEALNELACGDDDEYTPNPPPLMLRRVPEFDVPIIQKTVAYTVERTKEPFFSRPAPWNVATETSPVDTATVEITTETVPVSTEPPPVITAEGTITPAPEFVTVAVPPYSVPVEPTPDPSDMTADELDEWMATVMKP